MPRLLVQVRGIVQGVGFRPFVYRLARARGLEGWVRNHPGGVELEVQGGREGLDDFLQALWKEKPGPARIQEVGTEELPEREAEGGFEILASGAATGTRPSVPADLAICPACAAEVATPGERRFRYPFTNCTYCGPRYSIIAGLPYDRPRTAMEGFPLCEACQAQYADPADRRFHAQPIACPTCGPHLTHREGARSWIGAEAMLRAGGALLQGRILALKGLGGYQLLVDATSEEAVATLRRRKQREEKPFAVMFPDLASLRAACEVLDAEAEILRGPEAPILLLRQREGGASAVAPAVAPGNPNLGAFLPSTPLHLLLLDLVKRPLVCTSGNLSEEPMCIEDEEAFIRLGPLADAFLLHDRPILRPVDDSVGRLEGGTLRLLRRARGFAPLPHRVDLEAPPVLALGGHLKSTLALLTEGQAVVSQHLGDMETPQGLALLARTVEDLLRFFQVEPARLACDLHPDYGSTRLGARLAEVREIPLIQVQHHHAHIAAVAAEKGLKGPLLGLAWDGSGFGPDGTIWGGEALAVDGGAYARVGHLKAFPLPGGERAVREPRRAALGLCWSVLGEAGDAARFFSEGELKPLLTMLERGLNAPLASSMGRLFDAAAALLGLRTQAGFEGQAAMALEFSAERASGDGAYAFDLRDGVADPAPLLQSLLKERAQGVDPGLIARRFHLSLAELAVAFACLGDREDVVLGGGCFQNRLLSELCEARLAKAGFRVHRPALFPPNDGAISLGQAWVAAHWKEA
ncbi:MAG TPA: carbamoyltransferase HypF [Holophagaceae bacterium]|nr:carbamoyltransferase HypF [Holophagaceae bacterium]